MECVEHRYRKVLAIYFSVGLAVFAATITEKSAAI